MTFQISLPQISSSTSFAFNLITAWILAIPGNIQNVITSFRQDNDKLHLNLFELEISGDPWASAEAVQECVTRALAAPLAPHTKILFSQRGLQYTEDYSNSIQRSDCAFV